jgi:hypothetical protein
MNKLLLILGLIPALAFGQNRPVLMGDTNLPGTSKPTGINYNTNSKAVTFPSSVVVTNGALTVSGAGTISFPASSITATTVQGVTTSAGAGDSGKIPKLDSSGKLSSTMLPSSALGSSTSQTNGPTTYMGSRLEIASVNWEEIMRITNAQSSGDVMLAWKAQYDDNNNSGLALHVAVRLLECPLDLSTTNVIDGGFYDARGGGMAGAMPFTGSPLRQNVTTNIYILQGQVSTFGAGEGFAKFGSASSGGSSVNVTNSTYITPFRSSSTVGGSGGLASIPDTFTNVAVQTTNLIVVGSADLSGGFTAGAATFGPTYISGGVFITNQFGAANVFSNAANLGGNQVTNLATGTTPSSAVTLAQLQGATNGLSGGGGSDNLALYTNGTRAMAASLNMGNNTLTNLADGVSAKDAVTLSQLQGATNGLGDAGSDAQALYTNGTRRMAHP